jgi:DNA mismatch repair protein MutS2
VRAAREEAERLVDQLRDEVRETRRALERQTVTAPSLDQSVARAEEQLGRLPEPSGRAVEREPGTPAKRDWRLGDRARSRTQGWEGRITALEKNGQRATLDAGGIRVTVGVDELEPTGGPSVEQPQPAAAASSGSISALRTDRIRHVASSLDLRGARVDEAMELLGRYLEDASLAGLDKVLIIHGLGTGALRDAVRSEAGGHPLVKSVRAGERGEGGDGATIVTL